MAIDTRNKRASIIHLGMPKPWRLLPTPDGTIDASDRLSLLGLYSGIAAGGAVTPPAQRPLITITNITDITTIRE